MKHKDVYVFLVCEDDLTEVVIKKMLQQISTKLKIYRSVRWNKDKIQRKISDFNHSAKGSLLYLVVTDQDTLDNCPAAAVEGLKAPLSPNLLYRFAVMEIESWIMADRINTARFFSIRMNFLPQYPDEIIDPKEHLVGLIRKHSSKNTHLDLIPELLSGPAKVGPGYNQTLKEFVARRWDVSNALEHSPSLKRTYQRLQNYQPQGD